MAKNYQKDKCETSAPAVPERVSVALGELIGEVHEGCWLWRSALACRC